MFWKEVDAPLAQAVFCIGSFFSVRQGYLGNLPSGKLSVVQSTDSIKPNSRKP